MISKELCILFAVIMGFLCSTGLTILLTGKLNESHSTLEKDTVTEKDFNGEVNITVSSPFLDHFRK